MTHLPIEVTPPLVPSTPKKRNKYKQGREKQSAKKGTDASENTDSDDDCSSGYWLRIPTERMKNTCHEQQTQWDQSQNPVTDSDVSEQEREESHIEPEHIPDPILLQTERQTVQGGDRNLQY